MLFAHILATGKLYRPTFEGFFLLQRQQWPRPQFAAKWKCQSRDRNRNRNRIRLRAAQLHCKFHYSLLFGSSFASADDDEQPRAWQRVRPTRNETESRETKQRRRQSNKVYGTFDWIWIEFDQSSARAKDLASAAAAAAANEEFSFIRRARVLLSVGRRKLSISLPQIERPFFSSNRPASQQRPSNWPQADQFNRSIERTGEWANLFRGFSNSQFARAASLSPTDRPIGWRICESRGSWSEKAARL